MTIFQVLISEPKVESGTHGIFLTADIIEIEADFYELKPDGGLLFYIGAEVVEEFASGETFGVAAPGDHPLM